MRTKTSHYLLARLSIQQRLPLLICSLLLSVVIIYGFANYYSLKKASLTIGKERLSVITGQISGMLGQSTQAIAKTANATAGQNFIIECLKSDGKAYQKETVDALGKLRRDTTWVFTELLNTRLVTVARSAAANGNINVDVADVISYNHLGPNSTKVGRIFAANGAMYYPVVTTVSEKNQVIGYIISCVKLYATKAAVAQLSALVGTGAGFYIVNTDGSFWTDMMKPVPRLPVSISQMGNIMEYSGTDGNQMMASAQNVNGSNWIVLVQFPEEKVLSGAATFVKWITAIGLVLTALGIFAAWLMSRSITRPLDRLIAAATAISQGNYSSRVFIDANQAEELQRLANAFNIMIGQVSQMHDELENKVTERTMQLENVNKELEAFSYSVSHDLRTPLRAINGYSIMLKEDYESELDSEGKRIIRNIITNAKMMGQLIDDLLSFSRLGKKELLRTRVDMQLLTETVVQELLQQEPEGKYKISINSLPMVEADQVMMKQVLINLAGNAIKYSSKKAAPEIEIGAMDSETKITFYIKDNGAGFDMAYVKKLFGVFQRLHSQEEFEGTGVGLALVKRIIDKHNGEIWAEGAEGLGAVFYFSLPKN